ncbi:MAG: hypothetical protein Q9163_003516 [Psora crenata]
MPSEIVTATIQATIITLFSCIIVQFLTPDDPPHYLSLILFGILATPPNFLWQRAIEKHFPGYALKKVEVDDGGNGVEVQKRLQVRNTIIKVILDQTLSALPNTAGYIGVTRWLRGVPLELCWEAVKESLLVSVSFKPSMSHPPPFRQRPNLHLALTQLTGSPRHPNQGTPSTTAFSTPLPTPGGTPFGITAFSPFRSAGLKAPAPYNSTSSFGHRRAPTHFSYGSYNFFRVRRFLSSKPIWFFLLAVALTLWWFNGGSEELDVVKLGATGLGKEFLKERRMGDYQFLPATNPKIHMDCYTESIAQRWNVSWYYPRTDLVRVFFTDEATGVYFDVAVRNTTSLFIALHNAPEEVTSASPVTSALITETKPTSSNPGHLSFRPMSNQKPAPPVSLLARIDDEEYVLLPNSSSLVSVCLDSLARDQEHYIRIVAPMIDDKGRGIVELEGLWLSKGGSLVKVAGSLLSEDYADEDLLRAENDIVGEKHRVGLNDLETDGTNGFSLPTNEDDEDMVLTSRERKKTLEIVTDSPGSFTGKQRGRRTGGADGLLAGVLGWEYLLGEMFGADHVGIGVDGMCLTQDCIGSTGYPAGLGDVFFRRYVTSSNYKPIRMFTPCSSGPYGSEYFEHSWMFTGYVPDVLVLNIGSSDATSFRDYTEEYNQTMWELTENFESTYVSLVKGIRRLGYPKHPAIVQSERLGFPGIIPSNVPASIPIFIMRPFRGHLEQATQNTVTKLRADGDKSVFWLDTSGWLDMEANPEGPGDFFLDESENPAKWRLTEQGNQRVAIFLHMHVCRYLAEAEDKCAFLPHEMYMGSVYDQEGAHLDRFLETEKERKLKELFWDEDENEVPDAMALANDLEG